MRRLLAVLAVSVAATVLLIAAMVTPSQAALAGAGSLPAFSFPFSQ